ncbi:probable G-protein coupled receptor No9 [Asterias rubens]|uniref:probable G-protein coupled receptor No9 n=1 Tax=Asterias rubens TaxID=7604 RepID=UPI001455975B|nr:probable G-protein coupled receptor No9 [Asterias rubens]
MSSGQVPSTIRADCPNCFLAIIIAMWLEASIATIANTLAVMAFFMSKKIRKKVSNYFILNLSVADLLVGAVVMPINNVSVYYGYWPFGKVVCKIWLLLVFACTVLSSFALVLISWDRYLWVRAPLVYIHNQSKKRALAVIAGTIFTTYTFVSVIDVGWEVFSGEQQVNYSTTCESEGIFSIPYAFITFAFEFVLPAGLLATFNIHVFIKIRKMLLQRQRTESGTISIECRNNSKRDKTTSDADLRDSSLRQPTSNGAASPRQPGPQAYRKSAIMLGLMTGAFIICWCPWFIIIFINALNGGDYVSFDLLWSMSYLLFANSAINPFLYASTNVHYKAQMLSLLCFFRRR